MLRRAVALVVAFIAAFFALPAADASPLDATKQLLRCLYASPDHDLPTNHTAPERGSAAQRAETGVYAGQRAADRASYGALVRPDAPGTCGHTTYDEDALLEQVASAVGTTRGQVQAPKGDLSSFQPTGVAAKGLSPEIKGLSEAHLAGSGTTVLGRFEPGAGYIAKAQARDASYFDIGDAWYALTPAQRTAANNHFLDVIAERGERVLLSVPKGPATGTGALADELAYLTREKGYVWVNQWSLRPGG